VSAAGTLVAAVQASYLLLNRDACVEVATDSLYPPPQVDPSEPPQEAAPIF
jgi:hypothetical protein